MNVKLEPRSEAQLGNTERLPHGWRYLKDAVTLICNGEVVYSIHVGSFPKVLHRGNETLGARVEQMFRLGLVSLLAPSLRLLKLLFCVPGCFAKANEP